MANELQSISSIFNKRLFRVPDYQRGFAWGNSQLVDFWEDLINLPCDRFHYTGLLSLKDLNKDDIIGWNNESWLINKEHYIPCHIVDGQQRLTTIVILINEIIELVSLNKSKTKLKIDNNAIELIEEKYIKINRESGLITSYIYGYEKDNPSSEYLIHNIYGEKTGGYIQETYYTKNLKNAKKFFCKNLKFIFKKEGIEGIDNLFHKLTENLMFNIHNIGDDYDVFVAFETMNNRGKKLTNLELLKNRLIYLTTLFSEEEADVSEKKELRMRINNCWMEVYYRLGMNKNIVLSDDEYLKTHWIIFYTYSRKRGDDYKDYLFNKFSAKNIFKKKYIEIDDQSNQLLDDDFNFYEGDINTNIIENDSTNILEPRDISEYVNSLMEIAPYWYFSFFPFEGKTLSQDEKIWIDKLNRISIGYFRPLVTVILYKSEISKKEKVMCFKAIERFIFISFRMGKSNSSFGSSDFYREAKQLYYDDITIDEIINSLNEKVEGSKNLFINNFIIKIDKQFTDNEGYYSWDALKYFLYEYEFTLGNVNNLSKIEPWEMFTKSEKDKVTIEHILPQTPTKYYWKNQFRAYNDDEIKTLSKTLGNLLPLSQKINSSLQNIGFIEKKESENGKGRRGYENGSHSEIEVSHESVWNELKIEERTMHLLSFLEDRWDCQFTENQKIELAHISFIHDLRIVPPQLIEKEFKEEKFNNKAKKPNTYRISDRPSENLKFWNNFTGYCKSINRDKIVTRKPSTDNWYDISVGGKGFHFCITRTFDKYISVIIYVENLDAFDALKAKKDNIENLFQNKLEWDSSRANSIQKRIIYKIETNIFNEKDRKEIFDWILLNFDKLLFALKENDFIKKTNFSLPKIDVNNINYKFWNNFTQYCNSKNKKMIKNRRVAKDNWITFSVKGKGFHLEYAIKSGEFISLIIVTTGPDNFNKILSLKNNIEDEFGHKFDWFSSPESANNKRIIYTIRRNYIDDYNNKDLFQLMVDNLYKLYYVLQDNKLIKIK